MKKLTINEMEEIQGGGFWSGCGSGLSFVSGMFVTGVGALAAWQVALIVAGSACVIGGVSEVI